MADALRRISAHAHGAPDQVAIATGIEAELTFEELGERTSLVHELARSRGLDSSSTIVSINTYNEYLPVVIAVMAAGGDVTLMPGEIADDNIPMTPELFVSRVAAAEPTLVICPERSYLAEHCRSTGIPLVTVAELVEWWTEMKGGAAFDCVDEPGVIHLFTSGTTGEPKRVALDGVVEDARPGLPEGHIHRYWTSWPGPLLLNAYIYHAAVAKILIALSWGRTVIPFWSHDHLHTLPLLVEHYRPDSALLFPRVWDAIMDMNYNSFDFSSLQEVVYAGEGGSFQTKRDMIAWLGPIVWEQYGSAEGGSISYVSSEEWLAKPGTVGRPRKRVEIRCDAGRSAEIGEVGEVCVEVNAEADAGKFVNTGDLGYLDSDGYLYLVGRLMGAETHSNKWFPREIEQAAVEVRGVSAAVAHRRRWGADQAWEVVVVVESVRPPEVVKVAVAEHLRDALRSSQPPDTIEVRRSLPRTASGKLARSRVVEAEET